ncbi:Mur ligase domain-containing protein [Bacillus velezensis]|nr:Mur ligase domain-containing protein [Bacillus velezensis]
MCIKGYTVDGHDFAQKAAENGALAIVAEKELDVDVPVIIVRRSQRALSVLSDAFYGRLTKRPSAYRHHRHKRQNINDAHG